MENRDNIKNTITSIVKEKIWCHKVMWEHPATKQAPNNKASKPGPEDQNREKLVLNQKSEFKADKF